MENSGFSLKKLTLRMALCFIVLPLLFLISMIYQNSVSKIIQEYSAQSAFKEKAKNLTVLPKIIESEGHSDKLLGGILASGFDSESCISRYESSLYRKTSTHKPSSYLISKLRKYEKRHKHCGPGTEFYNKAVKGLDSSHANVTSECSYIVWLPSNGLGNRIVSMTAAFLYSLVTDRVLLVHHGTDMADLFCEPFPNTSWFLPSDFPLIDQFDSSKMRNNYSYGALLKNNNTNTSTLKPPGFLFLYLAYNYDESDKLFYLDQNQDFLRKVPWLILRSDQYFVPYLFLIKSFQNELNRLFPDKETVFHNLSRYLFHPSNQAWGLITRFYQAYLARADEIIGLQIRLFDPKSNPSDLVMKQILSCTENENLLPKLVNQKNTVTSASRNQTLKAILVASLHSEYYTNLKNIYWTKPTATGEAIGVYQPSNEEYQHFGDNMHNIKAWAEMYVLSLSDVLVTSSWSTFGYVAQGLGGLRPWIMFMPDNRNIPNPPCRRVLSMEPCFHYPPSYDRDKNVRDENVDLGEHVTQCEDVSWGVKLVNSKNNLFTAKH
ncbi:galactoside 2-alpha-L-fucosyltransferase-like [Mercurialis annua]|uniref:galactoside 2-alpha-L-fucosyltransferase-like n=1 Tax=Mercurialis annua TaxID=3986 RepID=UPI00215F3C58|nr:galactoside 2-alpha-L-fucosyltransferase-like [Mercurialis annua]